MKITDKIRLLERVRTIEGLTSDEREALIALINDNKTYGLVWENKPEAVEKRLEMEYPILTEVPERAIISDNPEAPNHILIEGDNLEALTTLSYTHEGKIDVIYIDPPYNTGKKDFIYNDTYIDVEDSYRHSKWLSFIYKRLKLAKDLLSDEGVIFISIDDNEQANLKLLCDDTFGQSNFLGQLILKTATDNNHSQINIEHEYMLCYCKYRYAQGNWQRQSQAAKLLIKAGKTALASSSSIVEAQKILRKWIKDNKSLLPQVSHYNNIDEKGIYSSSGNSSNPHPGGYTYDIYHPLTHLPCPKPANGWRWPEATFLSYASSGEIEWGKDHTTQPHVKKRIETSMEYLRTLIYEDNRGTTKTLTDIFGGEKRFDNPKPTTVLSRIIDFSSSKDSIILDFFAGSGTTLHATMQLNAEDGGKRTCILCTNNENGICENVTYERNKRVINGYTKPNGDFVEGLHDNNLRYYRTDFVSRERTQKNRKELMEKSTDLLCIKEDLYTEKNTFGRIKLLKEGARYFENDHKRMLVIYQEELIPYFVNEIDRMDVTEPIKVYVYARGRYAYDDEFAIVAEKVSLCALPQAIIDAMARVMPENETEKVSEPENSTTTETT